MRTLTQKTVTISGFSHDGRGIARDQEKVIFVFGALPGEKIDVLLTRTHRRFDEGKCQAVHEASVARVLPSCEAFGVCGGCQLQHMDPVKQIEYKQSLLKEQLKQAKLVPQSWLPPLTDQFYGYRQKARLGVRYVEKKQDLLVGFREQHSHKIAMIKECMILDPRLGLKLDEVKQLIASLKKRQAIPQVEVAIGGEEIALVFRHTEPLGEEDVEKLLQFSQTTSYAVYLQPGSPESVYRIGSKGEDALLEYKLADQGLRYLFHPLDFTQVNGRMNQAMINQALARVDLHEKDRVLDLFCGLGNFSLPFAQRVNFVVGVEGSANMVERAKRNAELNDLHNLHFYTADLGRDFSEATWAQSHYDIIVLDPPRSGALEVVNRIGFFQARAILYISCNPATFVRDAKVIEEKGYTLAECGVMDMFPQTAHVEAMGLFILKEE